MIRRTLKVLVLALSLFAVAPPTPVGAQETGAVASTRYVVEFRRPGETTWARGTEHPTREAADRDAAEYRRLRFEARVEAVTPTTPRPAGVLPQRDVVTYEQAEVAFRWMAAQDDIAFGYLPNGCFARTHLMVNCLRAMGLTPGKVWAFEGAKDVRLHVRTKDGYLTWWYHNAPTLRVRLADGAVETYVIDPALFRHPVTVDTWKRALMKPGVPEPFVTETRVGEAPTRPGFRYGGTGYWPSTNDPAEGCDANATATMRECFEKLRKGAEGR